MLLPSTRVTRAPLLAEQDYGDENLFRSWCERRRRGGKSRRRGGRSRQWRRRRHPRLTPNFGTYYPAGTVHTWLTDPKFYTEAEGGTKLVDWFTAIVNGTGVSHVGM